MSPNLLTNEGAESLIDRNVDWIADTIKAMACSNVFVADRNKQFIDEGGASDAVDARIAGTTDQTIPSRSIGKDTTNNFIYLLGGSVTFTGVPSGTITQIVIYKSTGIDTTSKILTVLDIPDTVANGGDITINFANAAAGGIIRLNT